MKRIMQSMAHQKKMAHISGSAILEQSTPDQHTPNTIKIKQGCLNLGGELECTTVSELFLYMYGTDF